MILKFKFDFFNKMLDLHKIALRIIMMAKLSHNHRSKTEMTEERRKKEQESIRNYILAKIEAEKVGKPFPHMIWESQMEKMIDHDYHMPEKPTKKKMKSESVQEEQVTDDKEK